MAQDAARRNRPRCANCLIEIEWSPVVANRQFYCCVGCAEGGPCSCDYAAHDQVIRLPGAAQGTPDEAEPER